MDAWDIRRMAFSPTRLLLARQRRRLTKQTLAQQSAVPARLLGKFEEGQAEPERPQLDRLATVLKFPLDFFFLDEPEVVGPDRASFRSMASMSQRTRDAVLAAAAIAIDINAKIEAAFYLPGLDLPDLAGELPETAAATLRAHWGLGNFAVPNLVHVLEARGVRVFSLAEDCRTVDAFALWDDATPYVFLNTLKSAEHGRWDAAHELGHLVLHRNQENRGESAEKEANRFAAAFLMPEPALRSMPGIPSADDLVRHKKRWGVSAVALARRLHTIGIMPDWYYERLMIEVSRRGWRTSEPEGMPRETSQIFDKVFGHWRERGISPASVAAQFRLHPDELSAFVFGRILHTLQGQGRLEAPSKTARSGLRLV